MSRSVDNVDLGTLSIDGNILGKDGDAALAFQVVTIQYLTAEVLSFAEQVSRQHHLIHQCGLTVVNVGNNCYVSDILHTLLFEKRVQSYNFSSKNLLE